MAETRTLGFLIYPDFQALDLVGPLDCFAEANARAKERGAVEPYRILLVGLDAEWVRAANGMTLKPDTTIDQCPPLHSLIIPGGAGSRLVNQNQRLLEWIRKQYADLTRLVSICTGAFVLAATGLAKGKRLTTHWRFAERLRQNFSDTEVEAEKLFVIDDKLYSSGGLSAGLDLTLAIIEEDLGAVEALEIAREMVMYMRRPGDQAQYSAPLAVQQKSGDRFAKLTDFLLKNLHNSLTMEQMAERMNLSARHFRRLFKETFNASPMQYLEGLRLDKGKTLLCSSRLDMENIASQTGFSSADVLGRRFKARFGVSPGEYRRRFSSLKVRE